MSGNESAHLKLLVVGLDGLDLNLIKEWVNELPCMASLIKKGAWGFSKSSDPPMSIPAWQYFYTGKQSGKHGVFHFYRVTSDGKTRIYRSSDLSSETLWDILDKAGVSCGIVSVPGTYPPSRLKNGYMLSGWPFGVRKNCAYPPELENELNSMFLGRDYRDPYPNPLSPENNDDWLKKTFEGISIQTQIVRHLLKNRPVTVFVVVFYSLDRASHRLFNERELLKQCYVRQDEALREILKNVSEDTHVILMSDHGFVGRKSIFFVNSWLRQAGYLELKKERMTKSVLRSLGITGPRATSVIRRMPVNILRLLPKSIVEQLWNQMPKTAAQAHNIKSQGTSISDAAIDWERTKAYSAGFWQIFINKKIVKNQDYGIVREEIVTKLRRLFLEKNYRLRFYRREDLFNGPFFEESPDIVFRTDDDSCIPAPTFAAENDQRLFRESTWGDHSQNGVVIVCGPSVRKDHRIEASILDICPTILHILGVPIPDDLDGNPIKEIFEPGSRLSEEEVTRTKTETSRSKPVKYTRTEEEIIKEKLHQLGYL